MLHVPVLRAGRPYRSLERSVLHDLRTCEPVAEVSQANAGLISRDLRDSAAHRAALQAMSTREIIEICGRAAELFVHGTLPVDETEGTTQTPEEFVRWQSATTGMPQALCRGNMGKIHFVLDEMERVLGGLTRGLDLEALDRGWVEQGGRTVSYRAQADSLGAILPSNSPGVHSLWISSLPLKVPLVLKPGREEPWTPLRIAQALFAAGLPREAISFYPTDYNGAAQVLQRCERSMFFGDASTVEAWRGESRIQIHGPGWSKLVFDDASAANWRDHLDLIATSVAENGGRSCVNASGVWTPAHGRELAEALAEKLAGIEARALDDPQASLAAFTRPEVARRVSDYVDAKLAIPGAEDLTAGHRAGRCVEAHGCTYLLPTVVWCEDPDHPLAATELLFPFVSVVQVPQAELLERIGPSLVVTALTGDDAFREALLASRNVERLNLGPLPTSRVSWDQPHEGNLFEHLYRQRAFQAATPPAA